MKAEKERVSRTNLRSERKNVYRTSKIKEWIIELVEVVLN